MNEPTELKDITKISSIKDLNSQEVEMIKKALGVEMMPEDFRIFLHLAKKVNLDPFSKQIYPVPFNTKVGNSWIKRYQTVIAIDGLRAIALRSGEYEGQTTPLFFDEETKEWEEAYTGTGHPFACKVGVYRTGLREPVYAVAHWEEYAKKDKAGVLTSFWKDKGCLMLAKCAEALALRKAFPNDTASLYIEEELDKSIVHVEAEIVEEEPALTVSYKDGIAEIKDIVEPLDSPVEAEYEYQFNNEETK